jgi:hypothetical protein
MSGKNAANGSRKRAHTIAGRMVLEKDSIVGALLKLGNEFKVVKNFNENPAILSFCLSPISVTPTRHHLARWSYSADTAELRYLALIRLP